MSSLALGSFNSESLVRNHLYDILLCLDSAVKSLHSHEVFKGLDDGAASTCVDGLE